PQSRSLEMPKEMLDVPEYTKEDFEVVIPMLKTKLEEEKLPPLTDDEEMKLRKVVTLEGRQRIAAEIMNEKRRMQTTK
ncbi:hypothetical protein OAN22_01930, partial [Alphaproteobacteria bacterium]|nr:hypothetical protein [Alphaproteobacteria bacterium]